jgi:threonine dehydrogenase-like Zn-dependent dehydrogenase
MKKASASMLIASETEMARRKAAKRIGADLVINPKKEDLVRKVKELTEGRGVDIAVEAVGHPSTAQQAIEAICPRGRAVMFGQAPPAATIPVMPHEIMRYEKEIVGSYANGYMFASGIRIMSARQVPSDVILTHRFKVSEFDKAMATHLSGESIKVLVSP